jgi:hypothetical protein
LTLSLISLWMVPIDLRTISGGSLAIISSRF